MRALLIGILLLAGCAGPSVGSAESTGHSGSAGRAGVGGAHARGLDTSQVAAAALADRVMERMGGRLAWDRTRYITFTFFGQRRHLWDKLTGDIRIEGTDRGSGKPYVLLMNLHTGRGGVWSDGKPVTDLDRPEELLEDGRRAWINDTYWLVMPYKLRDPGVTLRHNGVRAMKDGRSADVLELTFDSVGVTPENKYEVYVSRETGLVEQWDFYAKADDPEPRFQMPWHDWQQYGGIMLSGDRGPRAKLTDIAVFEDVNRLVFSNREVPMPSVPARP